MTTPPRRVSVPAVLLAALCGAVLGLLTFATAAALWRSGHGHAAAVLAETMFVTALALVAAVALLAQPARQRRARVPVGRPLPRNWWPPADDPLPTLAVCMGTPVAVGAIAAALLFR
jgi:DNA-directed RNA polymerase